MANIDANTPFYHIFIIFWSSIPLKMQKFAKINSAEKCRFYALGYHFKDRAKSPVYIFVAK